MGDANRIGGRFELGSLLGEGGMGQVYRGTDLHTDELVAIKLLKPDLVTGNPELVERFAREGEALRLLNHPNIVKVLAALEEDGQHYLVMEYVGGGSLHEALKSDELLPLARLLSIALDLCDALTRAHRLNIIHRDLKPANVLLADDGTPRLSDFGIAHMGERERVTSSGVIIGTLDYLSPEMFIGEPIDALTDIWAFGVMLFEMLTGQCPFSRASFAETMSAILTAPPPDLEALRPDAPIALVDLIYRMLEKDRSARIPSVRQVGAALESILHHQESDAGGSIPVSPAETRRFETPTPAPDVIKHNLPKQPTPFMGREQELSALIAQLADPQIALVTIIAPGGMGKTRLALEAAERLSRGESPNLTFPNGVYLVELAPLSSAEHIVPTMADAVGFQFYPGGEPKQQLLDYLREKEMLLVLDNFEHLLDGAALVNEILQTARKVKIIVTSRERLNLRGETLFTLGGMDFPDWETPQDAMQYSAVRLFAQSARRIQPGFELTADDLKYVARICELVQGMPLGIELAAACIGMLSLEEITSEISRSLDFLETDLRDVPERQRSIRAVFDYSWNLLADDERAIFARTAVFRGGFSRQAAQAITGASLRQLTALVNKSLLKRDASSGSFQAHELLRQYAEEKLNGSGEAEAIGEAHSEYYLNAMRQRQHDLEGSKQLEALKEIESDIENVRAAWLWAAQHDRYEAIGGALHSLWLYYHIRGQQVQGEALFQQAADGLRNSPSGSERDTVLGSLLSHQAALTAVLAHHEKAQRLIEEGRIFLQYAGTPANRAFLAVAQGDLISKPRDARPFFQEALALYRQTGDQWGIARALLYLGATYSIHLPLSPRRNRFTTGQKNL